MHRYLETLAPIYNHAILFYAIAITLSYIVLATIALLAIKRYQKANKYTNYRSVLSSPYTPGVSLIAPAYNEELTIVDNIRSLLSLYYTNFEVIIVNDGSKDNTLAKMIAHYDLEKVNFAVKQQVACKNIRGIYKSRNQAFYKLVVVDKENGGKSDALNAGINIATHDLITCIDVDCIIEQDAILKMVKPFMESSRERVIAVGGVIRIANSCIIEDGRLIAAKVPDQFLPRMQTVEYFRAFLMGRMGWSAINGLLLISGALGMFDKRLVVTCGGYNHNTVGEDMELVVRMRRHLAEQGEKGRIVYLPEPLCWTEAPVSRKVLSRQRNRWTRGTAEVLWIHRKMLFNPKYGMLGLVSFPYWMLFEWLAPILEFLGLVFFVILTLLGMVNWKIALALMVTVYVFAVTISFLAIFYEELSYRQYRNVREMGKLMLCALIEPVAYHPFVVKWAIEGHRDLIKGKKSWGEMTRTGFTQPNKK